MKINEYLENQAISQAEFARRLGVTTGSVWQWVEGRVRVSPERAAQIEQVTAGAVKRHELRPDLFDAPQQVAA